MKFSSRANLFNGLRLDRKIFAASVFDPFATTSSILARPKVSKILAASFEIAADLKDIS
jgi:hypothetical protein